MNSKLPVLAVVLYVIGGVGLGISISAAVYGYGLAEPARGQTTGFSALGLLLMFLGFVSAAGVHAWFTRNVQEAQRLAPQRRLLVFILAAGLVFGVAVSFVVGWWIAP